MPPKKPPVPAKNAPASKAGRPGDDKDVWAHVAKSVTPLPGRRKTAAAVKSEQPAKASAVIARPRQTIASAVKNAGPSKGFDRATETKLRKGRLDIEARLDLHGMTQGTAHRTLEAFIARAARDGRRTVLVITGKGRVGEGGGVLRRLVPLWLAEGSMAPRVLAITPAQPKDGGTGALYVRLRKKI